MLSKKCVVIYQTEISSDYVIYNLCCPTNLKLLKNIETTALWLVCMCVCIKRTFSMHHNFANVKQNLTDKNIK